MLNGSKTLVCQPCVSRVCLVKPRMTLGEPGVCKNGTVNIGTNEKVGKHGTCFQYWDGGLECGFEVRILGLYLGFGSLGVHQYSN